MPSFWQCYGHTWLGPIGNYDYRKLLPLIRNAIIFHVIETCLYSGGGFSFASKFRLRSKSAFFLLANEITWICMTLDQEARLRLPFFAQSTRKCIRFRSQFYSSAWIYAAQTKWVHSNCNGLWLYLSDFYCFYVFLRASGDQNRNNSIVEIITSLSLNHLFKLFYAEMVLENL